METAYLLVHSPLLGPRSWAPVAARLRDAGAAVAVPPLVHIADDGPPFAPRVAAAVAAAGLPPGGPVAVVAHSSAGLFVPAVAAALGGAAAACVFVEAALPARSGPSRAATPERVEVLRGLARDGRLPRWTDWWEDVTPLFPDAETQREVSQEQPRLPLSYYTEPIANPPGWAALPCGYILFSPAYEPVAADARERGWPVVELPGRHFHQLVDPDAVTAAVVALAA
ncbi:alpha/beta hydrolase [Dactylosporangium sp. McL0621]|uniref:alpha/beta hydrolase n=1 Tax=Dactylosporangium sp. McL0621 TaxID=3415678 RepID=UPI003CF83A9B